MPSSQPLHWLRHWVCGLVILNWFVAHGSCFSVPHAALLSSLNSHLNHGVRTPQRPLGFRVPSHLPIPLRMSTEPEEASSEKQPMPSQAPAPKAQAEEKVDLVTYFFGKPGELDRDFARLGTSRRRFFTINAAAFVVALGGNFLGVTSFLLGLLPNLQGLYLIPAELTQFYPVNGWKRYRGKEGYEFQFPQEWLVDQSVAFANQRGPADSMMGMKKKQGTGIIPAVAMGPAQGDARENVSVIKQKLQTSGFSLRTNLGEPSAAAQRLLDTAIAPPASGKVAKLLSASAEQRGATEVYQFEYVITLRNGLELHNVCAICTREDVLYTLTVLAPEQSWESKATRLRQVASSFKLV